MMAKNHKLVVIVENCEVIQVTLRNVKNFLKEHLCILRDDLFDDGWFII